MAENRQFSVFSTAHGITGPYFTGEGRDWSQNDRCGTQMCLLVVSSTTIVLLYSSSSIYTTEKLKSWQKWAYRYSNESS